MSAKQQIPVLTTQDLWNKYVTSDKSLNEFFRDKPEEFLITRIEDTKKMVSLPTVPHRRNVNEIVFITNGKCTRGCNLNKIEIGSGEIHLALSNQILTLDKLSRDVKGFYCHFSLETIIKLYHKEHMINELSWLNNHMKSKPVELSGHAFLSVKSIFERLLNEYNNNNESSIIDAYLVTLCYEIKNSIKHSIETEQPSKSWEITEEFKQLIIQHLHTHQPITFYAEELNISPNHLNKVVKETSGKPATALIAEMMALEAKVLLKHSELTISEIAYKLGFMDQSYFSRFFKLQSGLTPKEYRELK